MAYIPLEDVIRFYKDTLTHQRYLLEPSVIIMLESTIEYLEKHQEGF